LYDTFAIFFDKIQQWCKTALFPHFWAMLTTKNAWKGPEYAKFAHIGDMVYSRGTDVHCEAQMRVWRFVEGKMVAWDHPKHNQKASQWTQPAILTRRIYQP
jgi:hypothetical protein